MIRTTVGALRGAVRRMLSESLPPLRGAKTVHWNDNGDTDMQFYDEPGDDGEWEETEIPGTDLISATVSRVIDYMENKVGLEELMRMSPDQRYNIALRGAAWAGVEEDAVDEVAESVVSQIAYRYSSQQFGYNYTPR